MCKGADLTVSNSVFHIFAGCPDLIMDLQMDVVLQVFQDCLQDQQSIDVCPLNFFPAFLPKCLVFVGPPCSSAGFGVLSQVLRSAPSCAVLITHVPNV